MAGRIPDQFIEDVVARTDLVELIGNRIKLKKSGGNHMGLCPFHNEKSPSFSVSDSKQLYHCFGCGASGNALTFLMEHDRLDFVEAIDTLASSLGIEVPREQNSSKEDYQKKKAEQQHLFDLMEAANRFFQQQLRQHPQKHIAVNYLKGRQMTGLTAKQFQLGYAPAGWDNLLKALGHDKETRKHLSTAGLTVKKDSGEDQYYDRFRERIIFPILDTRGRTVAFGGRVLGDEKPKYLNSPETPIFHKSQILYGLYQARQKERHPTQLVIVEGYMDVIALAQHDIHNAVAPLGTAITEDHIRLLFKQTSSLIFCFDGDTAGKKAAKRSLELSLPQLIDGREIRFLFLPEGEDPDTVVNQGGKQAFIEATEQALTVDQYLFELYQSDQNTLESKAKLAKELMPVISGIPGEFLKNLLIQMLARKTGLTQETLEKSLNQLNEQQKKDAKRRTGDFNNSSKRFSKHDSSRSEIQNKPSGKKSQKAPYTPNTQKPTPQEDYSYAEVPHYPDMPSEPPEYPESMSFPESEYTNDGYDNHYQTTDPLGNDQNAEAQLAFKALKILLHHPECGQHINTTDLQLHHNTSSSEALMAAANYLQNESTPNTAQLLGHFHDHPSFQLMQDALKEAPVLPSDKLLGEIQGIIARLVENQKKALINELKHKITNKNATAEESQLYFQMLKKQKGRP